MFNRLINLQRAWLTAASGVVGGAIDWIANKQQTDQSESWSQNMYNQERKNALADWNMQNAYNSPAAQMQRFKQAGLNPNLIYGRGDSGNAGAVSQASPPSVSRAPYRSDLGSVGANVAGMIMQDKQFAQNMAMKNAELAQQEAALKEKGREFDIGSGFRSAAEQRQEFESAARVEALNARAALTIDRDTRVKLDNEVEQSLNEAKVRTAYAGAMSAESAAAIKGIEAQFAPEMARLKVDMMQGNYKLVSAKITELMARTENETANNFNIRKAGGILMQKLESGAWQAKLESLGADKGDDFALRWLISQHYELAKSLGAVLPVMRKIGSVYKSFLGSKGGKSAAEAVGEGGQFILPP